jgi:hypothetical protein
MDSGVPLTPSFTATSPMPFTHFKGTDTSVFYNGMKNYDTQSMPWVSNHFSNGMLEMSSHFPSSASSPYVNPSCGSGGMLPPYSPFSFGGSHIPQTTLTVGVWNIPPTNPLFQEQVLKWAVILLITLRPPILPLLCQFLRMIFPWRTFVCPLVFHLEGLILIVWETPFTKFLHPGETYILT